MKLLSFIFLFFIIAFALPCQAQEKSAIVGLDEESLADGSIAIYGTACEKIKNNEPKSSIRVRATDKASFLAVNSISVLAEHKAKANEHDFNVLVYNLVDNFVEDLAVRTTKQNENEICVEVTGYLTENDIKEQIQNKPQENLTPNEEAKENIIDIEQEQKPQQQEPQNLISNNIIASETERNDEKKALVFIANTEFFDNTISETHSQILKNQFQTNEYFYITDQKSLADYIVKSKILRAKVDPINSNTNRLQMVVSVELENLESHVSTIEHQNRFVLFANDENEQDVAYNLMKKLFEKAGEQVLQRIESFERRNKKHQSLPKIITPVSPHSQETNVP